jgi:protein-L-isoaspartate(D-aspartate) O-methyltransferase
MQFDAIILTAAPRQFPESLPNRLKPGGKIVLPVGEDIQDLKEVTKDEEGNVHFASLYPVRFVPLRRHE